MTNTYEAERKKKEKRFKNLIVIGGILFVGLMVFLLSFSPVGKGKHGCIFSNTDGWDYNERPQGWGFRTPVVESIQRMSFQTQELGIHKGGRGEYGVLTPKDKNGINFEVDVTIKYAMDRNQICEFMEEKGRSTDMLLLTALRADSTRGVFGKYAQEDVPDNRIDIALEIRKVLQERVNQEKIGKLQDGFIQILAVDVRNVDYNDEIEQAIITKQGAKQQAEKQVYLFQEEEKKKEIAIVQAEATKESAMLVADGKAYAILKEATAVAQGTDKVNRAFQGMPPQYVEVKYAEALKELAGSDSTVVMDLGRFQSGQNIGVMGYNMNQLMSIPQVRTVAGVTPEEGTESDES